MIPTLPRVCVVGSSNVDLIFYAAHLPAPGETLLGAQFRWGCGGKGANQATASARLGAEVAFVTKLGDDFFGAAMRDAYRRNGLLEEHLLTDRERATGSAAIIVDRDGRNQILVALGANEGLSPDDVSAAAGAFRGAKVVVCQLETPVETVAAALSAGRTAGAATILNPAPAVPLPDAIWPLIDWLTPNEIELATLAGAPPREEPSLDDVAAASRTLLDRGVKRVLTTLGRRGALWVDRDRVERFPTVAVQPHDTTGAGDAFSGAFAAGLAHGLPAEDAIRRANAFAAFSVTRPGTQSSYPTRAEFDSFYATHAATLADASR